MMSIKSILIAGLVGIVTARPLEMRQIDIIKQEFSQGGCRDILFAWARGSTGVGNMASKQPKQGTVGPPTSNALKQVFGDTAVATEGINYAALLTTNLFPGGTDSVSKNLLKNTLTSMADKCPDSVIVSGGYSQGAAMNHRAIEELPAAIQDRIAGVVLYGDTQNKQDNGRINNFPAEKVKIICQPGDLICEGSLVILPAHLTYPTRVGDAVEFLAAQIRGAQAKIRARNAKRDAEDAAASIVTRAKKIAVNLV